MAQITLPNHGRPWLYAFNVAEIRITDLLPGATAEIQVGTFIEKREADYKGEIVANISAYLQSHFEPTAAEDFDTIGHAYIKVTTSDGTTAEETKTIIYGAVNPGENDLPNEMTRGTNEVHVFPAVYQDLTILREYSGTIRRYGYNDEQLGEPLTFDAGQTIITGLSDFLEVDTTRVAYFTDEQQVTPTRRRRYRFDVIWHDEENGLFLRWLDRFGGWRVWRFDVGNDERKSGTTGVELPFDYFAGNFRYIAGAYQQRTQGRSVSLIAPLVDFERFEWLCSLMSSPVVFATIGGEWRPVSVSAGSNVWARDKNEHLQDFELSVVFPELITQSL